MEVFSMLNPVRRAATRADAQRYKVEPYVVAADVYGEAPHEGRGGWTWYTGSAGWLYRAALESILGVRLRENQLTLSPCVPPDWPGFSLRYRHRDALYVISVDRQVPGGVMQMTIDGHVQKPGRNVIDLLADGAEHSVHVVWLAASAAGETDGIIAV
jgi:cyclic beta-1,2-glucan synthetase